MKYKEISYSTSLESYQSIRDKACKFGETVHVVSVIETIYGGGTELVIGIYYYEKDTSTK